MHQGGVPLACRMRFVPVIPPGRLAFAPVRRRVGSCVVRYATNGGFCGMRFEPIIRVEHADEVSASQGNRLVEGVIDPPIWLYVK